jgi:hypothetical protein
VVPVISDAGRIPRWYSLAVGIVCCSLVILVFATALGDAADRGITSAIVAVLGVGYFWLSRRIFREFLTRPLPRRGLGRWLVSLPGRLMVLATVACWLIPLGLVALAFAIRPWLGNWHGTLVSTGPLFAICALGQAGGWLELRRMQCGELHRGTAPGSHR